MKTTSLKLATIGALLASASIANAALISLNYNGGGDSPAGATLSGPGGGLGTTWNQVSSPANTGALLDSTGASTTISVTTNYENATLGVQTAGTLPIFRSFLNVFARPNANTVTINGLASGGLYDIWLTSYRDILDPNFPTERNVGTWATTNTTTSSSSQTVNSQTLGTNGGSFVAGYNYVLFSNVQATAGGVISFTANGDAAGRRLHLNGLQINAVPEPGTAILGGLAFLALLRRRRA